MIVKLITPVAVTLVMVTGACRPCASQGEIPPLLKAASNDELLLPAWGPYSPDHIGPCCLVNRLTLQQFAFPIVISQQRDESMVQSERGADGRLRTHVMPVVLLRRIMGLSQVQAAGDDRPLNGSSAPSNRMARPADVDRDALLWRVNAAFGPAAIAQNVVRVPDSTATQQTSDDWGEGAVVVEYFPAFGETRGDGLIIRIALTNRSDRPQTYCVDMLGGLDSTANPALHKDLAVETSPQQSSMTLGHPQCAAHFAISAPPLPYVAHSYKVSDAYFGTLANVAYRRADGAILPDGVIPPGSALTEANAHSWALVRVQNIGVDPGHTVTLFLSIGVGTDADTALAGSQTLLNIADDVVPGQESSRVSKRAARSNPPILEPPARQGAYSRAIQSHEESHWSAHDPQLAGLMAQTVFNAPLQAGRRRGIASRTSNHGRERGKYNPTDGAMIALALAEIRPFDAAAELNIHYWTQAQAPPHDAPRTLAPINLLVLWELFQHCHDLNLLQHFYPAAARDYREMVAAAHTVGGGLQYMWPDAPPDPIFAPDRQARDPHFAAYVICAAHVLHNIAVLTGRPSNEVAEYTANIAHASAELNNAAPTTADRHGAQAQDAASLLLPLIAGTTLLTATQRSDLLTVLTDPKQFWSPVGVRQRSSSLPGAQSSSPDASAVRFGLNWLIWKALIDIGSTTTARQLANNLLTGYTLACRTSGGFPEWLDAEDGRPEGALDVSGDACALVPMFAAYHIPGTITTGWSVAMLDRRYDSTHDSLHVAFRNLEADRPAALICALGKPNGEYNLSGALHGSVTADANGVITLQAPLDPTTQSLDIDLASGPK